MTETMSRRGRATVLVSGAAVTALLITAVLWTVRESGADHADAPVFTRSAPTAERAEGRRPAPGVPEAAHPAPGSPADATSYELAGLTALDARVVVPGLEVDAAPAEGVLPLSATPVATTIPVFRTPGEAPVAQMRREQQHDGTTVPVVEQHDHWVRVLLPARSGVPSLGVVGQQTGWLRASDVVLTANPYVVSVDLSSGRLVVTSAGEELTALQGFGYGTPSTPTPIGRSYIMTTFTDPKLAYTRGLPVVALAVQSPTLDGFAGQDVAVTAFHFHDARNGAISNGCIRVDEATILVLAGLPLGTPVVISA